MNQMKYSFNKSFPLVLPFINPVLKRKLPIHNSLKYLSKSYTLDNDTYHHKPINFSKAKLRRTNSNPEKTLLKQYAIPMCQILTCCCSRSVHIPKFLLNRSTSLNYNQICNVPNSVQSSKSFDLGIDHTFCSANKSLYDKLNPPRPGDHFADCTCENESPRVPKVELPITGNSPSKDETCSESSKEEIVDQNDVKPDVSCSNGDSESNSIKSIIESVRASLVKDTVEYSDDGLSDMEKIESDQAEEQNNEYSDVSSSAEISDTGSVIEQNDNFGDTDLRRDSYKSVLSNDSQQSFKEYNSVSSNESSLFQKERKSSGGSDSLNKNHRESCRSSSSSDIKMYNNNEEKNYNSDSDVPSNRSNSDMDNFHNLFLKCRSFSIEQSDNFPKPLMNNILKSTASIKKPQQKSVNFNIDDTHPFKTLAQMSLSRQNRSLDSASNKANALPLTCSLQKPNSEYNNRDRYTYERSPRQSQRAHGGHREEDRREQRELDRDHVEGKRAQFTRSLSNTEAPSDEKTGAYPNSKLDSSLTQYNLLLDGSLSDTALGQIHGLEVPQNKEVSQKDNPREWDRTRNNQFIGLNKKSNSTSQLSATGKFIICDFFVCQH